MIETAFLFIMKCLWGLIHIGFLIAVPFYAIWFAVAIVDYFIRSWKGRDNTRFRFPPRL